MYFKLFTQHYRKFPEFGWKLEGNVLFNDTFNLQLYTIAGLFEKWRLFMNWFTGNPPRIL